MTPEERAEAALAGLTGATCLVVPRIARAIREAVEEEREACERIAMDMRYGNGSEAHRADEIAAAIRARGA